jgi:hypothetical protein
MSMPEDAQLSEDGNFWWDGTDWQPVPGQAAASESESGEVSDEEVQAMEQQMESDPGLSQLSDTDLASLSDDEE